MIQINGLEQNSIMKFIQSSYQILASSMEDFHHLKFRARFINIKDLEVLSVKAYGETEEGKSQTYEDSELFVSGPDLKQFIDIATNEVCFNLDTAMFLQLAPRVSIVLQNTPFNAAVEIQFLNIDIDKLFVAIRSNELKSLLTGYPGVEMNFLIRPLEYQAMPLKQQPERSAVVPPHVSEPEPATKPDTEEEPTEELRNLQSFISSSFEKMAERAKAHENDSEEPSNPYEEITAPTVIGGVGEDFWKILKERGAERSKFNEKDNDMQKRISMNRLSDDSKNILDILDEEPDEEAMVANAREASEANLDEMFADDEEPMPEPPAK